MNSKLMFYLDLVHLCLTYIPTWILLDMPNKILHKLIILFAVIYLVF